MDQTADALIKEVLAATRTIAVVGASPDPSRDSNSVMRFLIDHGYEVYPVNPLAGVPEIHGRPVYASLEQLPVAIDLVDVFRRSDAAGDVCDEAIAAGAKAVWMQLGVVNEAAAERARAAGLKVVMDRCVRIEVRRLGISGPATSPPDDIRDAR
jgi:predicted CoA-binding protein